ncbi:MAG: DUF177 domain-containing protein [Zymomonas mobilis subsp. pomaceae]|uniref:DUF177 domain-containing protein n=1 Tax=Zymomonas mobilis subsp. pomaceae (strain ATCC 29192 / DSM 22645 / JCM 10191 / CCUG 17912 / NBRC 13757 / NCIMB 11200 / NRRL B-4491 / Barker I) TaxID=579138 RepID=F8EU86_ZYMMT|nr:DUF177 domain-containing protein [Zymomonas mobilis]AEI38107.1 protein of unknown function DUF177 [Zymomonas mobilis subsp. pomaceae ATCC 29192]MDX5949473.1 DUF177 domain-containing protein [Zymomonas mobilis subsp. pomaceae]GEB89216.1 hypothetical protein ZMO02_08530 [Zymomonas mobilis subsp. pomaceae]
MNTSVSPEFSRIVTLDHIGEQVHTITLTANEEEKAALAKRFSLEAIKTLEASIDLHREGKTVLATGKLKAEVCQNCSATGLPLPTSVREGFSLKFIPETSSVSSEEEIELSSEDCDVLFYTHNRLDLGEAVAETLILSLPAFPRHPQADQLLQKAGVVSEEDIGPFSALKILKQKIANK